MDYTPLTEKERKEAEATVEKLFALLEIDGTFTIDEHDEVLDIVMETKDTGMIIGYHGEILESLQLILSLTLAKKLGRFVRISLDVDGYKKNRADYLEKLAMQIKEKALAENKEQVLLSLKSWERRIVHMLLKDDAQVTSESSGEGRDRVLIIKPK